MKGKYYNIKGEIPTLIKKDLDKNKEAILLNFKKENSIELKEKK